MAGRGDWRAAFGGPVFTPTVLVVVPNALVRRQLIEEILSAREVVLGPKVETFAALEAELLADLGLEMVDPWVRTFRLVKLAPRLWEPLGLPGDPDSEQVLAAALAERLGDGLDRLRLADIPWDDIERLEPAGLAREMAAIGRDYEAWLGEREDRDGARRRLLRELADPGGLDFSVLREVETVICAHSDHLTPFEAELLKALAARHEVELRLSAPAWLLEERPSGAESIGRLLILRDLEKNAPPGLTIIWADPEDHPELLEIPEASRHASDNLLGPPAKTEAPPVGDALCLFETPTLYHEVEEIGRRLKRLLVDGAPAHRLAVALPDPRTWLPAMEDVGRRLGLPLSLRRGLAVRDQGPVRIFLDIVDLWDSNWELPRILKILESPYLGLGLPDGFRPALLEAGILDDRAEGGLEANLAKIRDPERLAILKPVAEVVHGLRLVGEAVKAAEDWGRIQELLRGSLDTLRGNPPDPPGRPDDPGPAWTIRRRETAAVKAMADALDALFDALTGNVDAPPPSLAAFRLWRDRVLGGLELPGEGGVEGGIQVLGYKDLHGARFDALFLAGLNDRVFPAAKADTCWWPEVFIEGLARGRLGRRLWSDAAETYQAREAQVAAALAQARRVTLSWHLADDGGGALLPAPLIESLKGLFEEGELKAERVGWPLPPPAGRIAEPGELWLSLAAAGDGASEPPEIFGLVRPSGDEARRLWRSLPERRARSPIRLKALPKPYLDAWLETLERFDGVPLLAIGPLTSRLRCPRKFLLQPMLGLGRWPRPAEGWGPMEWGDVIHHTLEVLLRRMADGTPLESSLDSVFWEEAKSGARQKPVGRQPVWEAQGEAQLRLLEAWLERQEDLKNLEILGLEWSFEPGGEAPPLLVETGVGTVALKGRVDRVERERGEIVLTDYKRSRSSWYKERKAGEPRELWEYQLLLYSLAAEGRFGAGEVRARLEFVDPKEKAARLELPSGGPEELAALWEGLMTGELPYAQDQDQDQDPAACERCDLTLMCEDRR